MKWVSGCYHAQEMHNESWASQEEDKDEDEDKRCFGVEEQHD